ncbi:MAG: tetratricopeptide repeat protein [Rikenellaceae bacterium]|nr:tetratricopeptide repeat protein [Rikenellaceae bacterium]
MNNYVFISLICLIICGCSENRNYKKATRYLDNNDLDKAIEYLDKVIAVNPNHYDANMDLGGIALESGRYEDAVMYFSKVITILPDEPHAYYNRAETNMRQENYSDALNDYNLTLRILVGNPDDRIIIIPQSYELFGKRIDPTQGIDPFTVFADRAVAYYYLDSLVLAYKDLNLCINNYKELKHCYYWRGCISLEIGDTKSGCEDLRKSASLGYNQAKTDYKKHCECNN